jgi:S-adenosyl-L-methionine hydrolase (adenosine-forming)
MSDYGLFGDLVGSCKGVMVSIAPQTHLVDITHSVPEFDVIRGAEILRHNTRYMPANAVYVAVVDPGPKNERRALAAEAHSGAYLVGPDNGLLLPAAEALGGVVRAVRLTNQRYHVEPVSDIFQGRDIFSPVAAHLAAGADFKDLGEEVSPASMASIAFPKVHREPDGVLLTQIIDIDRFGNARLSAMQKDLDLQYGAPLQAEIDNDIMDARYVQSFGASQDGDLVLVPDSHWRLSLAINKGNAARALLLAVGDQVRIEPSAEELPPG